MKIKEKDKERKLRRTRQAYNLFQDLWNKPIWVSKLQKKEKLAWFTISRKNLARLANIKKKYKDGQHLRRLFYLVLVLKNLNKI